MKNEKLLKWAIYIAGIACLYAFISIRSLPMFNTLLKEKMVPGYWDKTKYGELYYFSLIRHFREEGMPPAQEKFQFKNKHANLHDAKIITIGDSFFDFSRHEQLPERLSDTLNVGVHFYKNDFPLAYLASNHYTDTTPKIMIYERVERYIPMAFENALYDEFTTNSRPTIRKKAAMIKDLIFYQRSEELFDALLKKSIFTTGIYSCISTLKFDLFEYISPLTPVYSRDKHNGWLFYHDQVNNEKTSFYYNHSNEEINTLCDNMKKLADQLDVKYNIRIVYMPLPAKYTLYHGVVNNDKYNDFLPRLFNGLKKRGVEYIDVYEDYKNSSDTLYYRTDSHWNEKGIEFALTKTLEYFRNDSTFNIYFTTNNNK
ncbi:MAG: hypothetical protein JXB00_11545 [Bacteroidales bacterium]|nr:hypothetical protein [Bacteroidales bacterium]